MEKLDKELERVLLERFGHDSIIALATAEDNIPYVRGVNAYYSDKAFYILTYKLSGKMKQIEKNPHVAVSGHWFTAQGVAENMGWVGREENRAIKERMLCEFTEWIGNGHTDLEDENSIILRVKLSRGMLFHQGKGHEIDFL